MDDVINICESITTLCHSAVVKVCDVIPDAILEKLLILYAINKLDRSSNMKILFINYYNIEHYFN